MTATENLTDDAKIRFDQLDSLMNAMVDAFIVIDERGNIERFNQAAETMFGYTAEEVRSEYFHSYGRQRPGQA